MTATEYLLIKNTIELQETKKKVKNSVAGILALLLSTATIGSFIHPYLNSEDIFTAWSISTIILMGCLFLYAILTLRNILTSNDSRLIRLEYLYYKGVDAETAIKDIELVPPARSEN